MKIAVDFPSIAFREGPQRVLDLAKAIEDLGYDEIAAFDHVVMGHPGEGRFTIYPANMPILEALMLLANVAAVTERVSLSTEVLVLPQRQPVLVAKQISTLDTLSNGRVRPRHRRGLAGLGVRRARRGLPHPRQAHGRGHRPHAGLLGRRPDLLRRRALQQPRHGHGARVAAGCRDSLVDRRRQPRCTAPHRPEGRRVDGVRRQR